ncbi:hypothetical protein LCGC14_1118940 [marine sediment metagenome]|uniref:Uncharacterized protein n=1 Tax=marine sediment metagenome TaxID=412755 RepID=A0A0F9M4J4_9ZZZZ
MNVNKDEEMKMLLDHGMNEEEAAKFLDGRDVIVKGLQLPALEALSLMNKMAEFGIFTGPVRFYVVISEDNEQRLMDLVESTGHPVAKEAQFDLKDIGKDPIGDYNRKVADGYAGTADFEGMDPEITN